MVASSIYWVTNSLAISPRPRGGDWLSDEVAAWAAAGIGVVVSALTVEEAVELELTHEEPLVRAQGIEFISLPIPDRGLPSSREVVTSVAFHVQQRIEGGSRALVHCRGGIGRATLIATAILIDAQMSPDQAIAAVEQARGRAVPDTPEQRQWILDATRANK